MARRARARNSMRRMIRRRRKRTGPTGLGKRFITANQKKYMRVNTPPIQENMKIQQLYHHEVEFPDAVHLGGALDNNAKLKTGNRTSNRIYLKGINLYSNFYNITCSDIEVHYAFLQSKEGEMNDVFTADFFRNDESDLIGSTDNALPNQSTYDLKWRMNKINSAKWNVLFHKKFVLGRRYTCLKTEGTQELLDGEGGLAYTGTNESESAHFFPHKASQANKKFDKYYAINKVVQFDQMTDFIPLHPLIQVCWFTVVLPSEFNGDEGNPLDPALEGMLWEFSPTVVYKNL